MRRFCHLQPPLLFPASRWPAEFHGFSPASDHFNDPSPSVSESLDSDGRRARRIRPHPTPITVATADTEPRTTPMISAVDKPSLPPESPLLVIWVALGGDTTPAPVLDGSRVLACPVLAGDVTTVLDGDGTSIQNQHPCPLEKTKARLRRTKLYINIPSRRQPLLHHRPPPRTIPQKLLPARLRVLRLRTRRPNARVHKRDYGLRDRAAAARRVDVAVVLERLVGGVAAEARLRALGMRRVDGADGCGAGSCVVWVDVLRGDGRDATARAGGGEEEKVQSRRHGTGCVC